jgi:hypothetical protein
VTESKPRDIRERAFAFSCDLVGFCRAFSAAPGVNRQIGSQLLKAGTSVGANLEEAKAAYSRRARTDLVSSFFLLSSSLLTSHFLLLTSPSSHHHAVTIWIAQQDAGP